MGDTPYVLNNFKSQIDSSRFYPASQLTALRRNLINLLDRENLTTLPRDFRRPENLETIYPLTKLDYKENVANHLAEEFYFQHGVNSIQKGAEISKDLKAGDILMTTRHCILRELGLCKKEKGKSDKLKFPLYLNYDGGRFCLNFNCNNCEMTVRLP